MTTSNAKFQAFLSESRNESMDQHMLCVVDVPLYAMVPDTQRKRRLHQYSRGNTHVVQVDLRAGPSRYSRPLTHIMAFCLTMPCRAQPAPSPAGECVGGRAQPQTQSGAHAPYDSLKHINLYNCTDRTKPNRNTRYASKPPPTPTCAWMCGFSTPAGGCGSAYLVPLRTCWVCACV